MIRPYEHRHSHLLPLGLAATWLGVGLD